MWKTGTSHCAVLITDTLIGLFFSVGYWREHSVSLHYWCTSAMHTSHEKGKRSKKDEKEKGGNNFFAVQHILFKMARLPDAPQLQQLADGNDCRWMGTAETQIQLQIAGSAVFAFPSASHSHSTSREWVAK